MGVRKENRWSAKLKQENDDKDLANLRRASLLLQRGPRTPQEQASHVSRRTVRRWLRFNACEYQTCTELAVAASCEFDLPDEETHWIWEDAVNAKSFEEEGEQDR